MFRQDAEKMKDLQEQSLKMYQRRNHIRCVDCVVDYIDQMISEFCDMLGTENGIIIVDSVVLANSSTSSPVNVTDPASTTILPTTSTANVPTIAIPTISTNINATL